MNKTVDILNAAFATDPAAIHALLCNRVPCNYALAEHEHIVVEPVYPLADLHFTVGALGLLNGVLSAHGLPLVAAKYSEPDEAGQSQLLGFCEYTE